MSIKGKNYITVNERLKYFRAVHPTWAISTETLELSDKHAVTKTSISDETGRILSTGMAYEIREASFINKTSWLENAETSSAGRALAMLGIGIEESVASADEVYRAIAQQKDIENAKKTTTTKANSQNSDGVLERSRV